jgi:hypothetical protein
MALSHEERVALLEKIYRADEFLDDFVETGDVLVMEWPDGTRREVVAVDTYKSGMVTFHLNVK